MKFHQGMTLTRRGTFGKLGLKVASWVPVPLTSFVNQRSRKSPFQSPSTPQKILLAVCVAASNDRKNWKHLSYFHHCQQVILKVWEGTLASLCQ